MMKDCLPQSKALKESTIVARGVKPLAFFVNAP